MDMETAKEMVEVFKEVCKTEEGDKRITSFLERVEREEKEKRELVEKVGYIKWLESFTKKHPDFSDDTWLYKQDEIAKEDYVNVCKLSTFFSLIADFADKHYIPASVYNYAVSYFIKYNGIIYDIGTIVGQGAVSYCHTLGRSNQVTEIGNSIVIGFEELADPSETTLIRTALIENQLQRIDDLYNILANNKELKIPIEAMIARSDKVLKELKEKTK